MAGSLVWTTVLASKVQVPWGWGHSFSLCVWVSRAVSAEPDSSRLPLLIQAHAVCAGLLGCWGACGRKCSRRPAEAALGGWPRVAPPLRGLDEGARSSLSWLGARPPGRTSWAPGGVGGPLLHASVREAPGSHPPLPPRCHPPRYEVRALKWGPQPLLPKGQRKNSAQLSGRARRGEVLYSWGPCQSCGAEGRGALWSGAGDRVCGHDGFLRTPGPPVSPPHPRSPTRVAGGDRSAAVLSLQVMEKM